MTNRMTEIQEHAFGGVTFVGLNQVAFDGTTVCNNRLNLGHHFCARLVLFQLLKEIVVVDAAIFNHFCHAIVKGRIG